jgi:hypothetical protein
MSTDNDVARALRSWLRESRHEDADRVLEAVVDQVPATPQRRSAWTAWRFDQVKTSAKLAIAAAIVVVLAIVGVNLLQLGGPRVGGPRQSASQPAEPTPSSAASSTPLAEFPQAGELAIGRHNLTLGGVRLSIEVPSGGWVSNGQFGLDKGRYGLDTSDPQAPDSAGFVFWTLSAPDNVYADPCTSTPLNPPAGPSAAELAAAVSRIPGVEVVQEPTPVTVDRMPAWKVVLTVPEGIGCAPTDFHLWYDESQEHQARYATEVGSTITAWIIDANGTIVWIDAETYATSSLEVGREIQQIIDSIRFAQTSGPG